MKEDQLHIADIISRYLRGFENPGDMQILQEWLAKDESNRQLLDELSKGSNLNKQMILCQQFDYKTAFRQVKLNKRFKDKKEGNNKRLFKRVVAYAAAILISLLVITGIFIVKPKHDVDHAKQLHEIKGGESKAELHLADGQVVELDEGSDDTLIINNNLILNRKGKLSYELATDQLRVKENKLIVPRGGEYSLQLADGTMVWLNSESELIYPQAFKGDIRKVKLKGEAYFDVAPNSEQAFIVETTGQLVKVLGTEFNIRAYADEEKVSTTLVEGSVQLISPSKQFKTFDLKPNEQTILGFANEKIIKRTVDVKPFISWKDGLYIFKRQPLEEVMQELARWYDVDVVFNSEVLKHETVNGGIRRKQPFEEFIDLMELIQIASFKIEGRTIIVDKIEE